MLATMGAFAATPALPAHRAVRRAQAALTAIEPLRGIEVESSMRPGKSSKRSRHDAPSHIMASLARAEPALMPQAPINMAAMQSNNMNPPPIPAGIVMAARLPELAVAVRPFPAVVLSGHQEFKGAVESKSRGSKKHFSQLKDDKARHQHQEEAKRAAAASIDRLCENPSVSAFALSWCADDEAPALIVEGAIKRRAEESPLFLATLEQYRTGLIELMREADAHNKANK